MRRTIKIFELVFVLLGAFSVKKSKSFRWSPFFSGVFLAAFIASPAAYGQVKFTEMVTFGDSLTHNDLLWAVSGKPRNMYGADPMEAVFRKASQPGSHLTSYAVAGTESGDLELEIIAYIANLTMGEQNKATFFGIETGGNDILNNVNLLGAHAPGRNHSADKVVNNIIQNIRDGFNTLRESHPKAHFVLWTIPDITLTPKEWGNLTRTEVANIRAHLKRVNEAIKKLGNFPSVVVLDLYTLIQNFIKKPPAIFGHQLQLPPVHGEYDAIFADEIHPTAVSNALIANTIIRQINAKWQLTVPSYTKRQLARLAHINP